MHAPSPSARSRDEWRLVLPRAILLSVFALPQGVALAQEGSEVSDSEETYTNETFVAAKSKFYTEQVLEPFDRIADREAPWFSEARKIIVETIAVWNGAGRNNDATAWRDGRKLIRDGGCADPMLAYIVGAALCGTSRFHRDAEPFLQEAVDGLADSGYPPLPRVMARRFFADYLRAWGRQDHADAQKDALLDELVELARKSAKDPETQRLVYGFIHEQINDSLSIELAESLRDRLKSAEEVDRWLALTVSGLYERRRAWSERGGGWGYEVNPTQWAGFDRHLTNAAADLVAAWNLDPKRPEPADLMIAVTMGGNAVDGLTVRDWFDRATSAQFDYIRAHHSYLWALRPRWGGSHHEMIEFGRECAATKRYDTLVPYFYYRALRDVSEDLHRFTHDHRRIYAIWNDEEVYGLFKETMSELRQARKPGSARREEIETAMVVVAWRTGRYAEALDLLRQEVKLVDETLERFCTVSDVVKRETFAYAGPQADDFRRANLTFEAGRWNEAAEAYRTLLEVNEVAEAEAREARRVRVRPEHKEIIEASVNAGDLARQREFAARAMVQFDAGEPVEFRFVPQKNVWTVLEGSTISTNKAGDGVMLRMNGKNIKTFCPMPVGQRWVLKGTIDFKGAQHSRNAHLQVLLRFHPDMLNYFYNAATFYFADKAVGLGFYADKENLVPAPIDVQTPFEVALWDGWASIAVGGEVVTVRRLQADPEPARPIGDYFALACRGFTSRADVAVSDLSILKLDAAPEAIAAAMQEAAQGARRTPLQ